jgi:uncharacterized protein (DUF433 family)
MPISAKQLKHPYITTDKKIRNGEPIISGTGIRVLDIAIRYELAGMTPDDIIVALPHINLSQVHDALSYYYDNKDAIDIYWKKAIKDTKALKKIQTSVLEQKIGKIKNIHR